MTDVRKMFAGITAAIEDLHGIALEGQASNLSPDIHFCLIVSISNGLTSLCAMSKETRKAVLELQS